MKKILLIIIVSVISFNSFATPKEIIIVRHADKWVQQNPGPFLSPKGQVRAAKFVGYYLSHFPKPDFIFASKPIAQHGASDDHSYRSLQTVIPLANQLAYHNPHGYFIDTRYQNDDYKKLANLLLHTAQYQNKIILICWHHGRANQLAQSLGVTQKLKKWGESDFDQVYVLHYNTAGKLHAFLILKNQYPVKEDSTWAELAQH